MLYTTDHVPGVAQARLQPLGLVTADGAVARALFAELATRIRERLGGRAHGLEHTYAAAKDYALAQLREDASKLGADNVIGVQVTVTTAHNVIVANVTGTAVRIAAEA